MTRIRIAESVMQKCGAFGLQEHDPNLAQLLKRMVNLSAIASGNFNDERRRYGSFILTVKAEGALRTLVDINTNTDEAICLKCLGTEFDEMADDYTCSCVL